MKILIAPFAVPLPTSGPAVRLAALSSEVLRRGHMLAVCAASDGNLQLVEGARQYAAPAPTLLGLPPFLAYSLGALLRNRWLQGRRKVTSFEHVLHLGGMLRKKYVEADVLALRQAIEDFAPDVVLSEYRYAAILAARLCSVPVATTHSFPGQASYASNPEYSGELRTYLEASDLPVCQSVLEIFEWADLRFIPSSERLEPMTGEKIHHVGPLSRVRKHALNRQGQRNNILFYLGNGSVSPKKAASTAISLFKNSPYDVYVAGKGLKPKSVGRVQVREFFDFSQLLPQAALFVNHGGQNSVLSALAHGVPQLVCPGNVFERCYQADSVVQVNAGKRIGPADFAPGVLELYAGECISNSVYAENAARTGAELLHLGGTGKVLDLLEEHYGKE